MRSSLRVRFGPEGSNLEDVTWQTYLLPWWKPLVYVFAGIFTLVTIKVGLTFNINTWLQDRRKRKLEDRLEQAVAECGHVWTLYPNSDFSQCNLCTAYIKTATLLFARDHFDEKTSYHSYESWLGHHAISGFFFR